MKVKNLLLAGLAVAAMTACSEHETLFQFRQPNNKSQW